MITLIFVMVTTGLTGYNESDGRKEYGMGERTGLVTMKGNRYVELVKEVASEPNYEAALAAARKLR